MSSQDVLLIGKRTEETVSIKQKLSKNRFLNVELATTAEQALNKITSGDLELVVFNFDLFTPDKIKLAEDIRDLGYDTPVLILSRIISMDSYDAIKNLDKSILLEKPFENKDLWGISYKLMQEKNVSQRFHRRFYTNQNAEVESFANGGNVQGKVYNLSRGGAYFEFESGQLSEGEILNMTIELKEVARRYQVSGQVVWTSDDTIWGNPYCAGIEFVKKEDVYRNLLNKL